MNKPRQPNPLNAQIRAEATEWLLRFSEGEVDPAGREAFSFWLRTSPEHVRAYLRVSAFWQEAGHLDGQQTPRDIDALVARAKAEANVFPLALGPHLLAEAAGQNDSVIPAKAVIQSKSTQRFALAASLLVTIGAFSAYQYLQRGVYQTEIGEQRTVNLPDGSTVMLNADSRIRVEYTDRERAIDLSEGQALFKVAKHAARPFIVRVGNTSVRAVGTEFDVYRKANGTTVTVVEGRVALEKGTYLSAGEQVTVTLAPRVARSSVREQVAPVLQVRPVKIEDATAWTQGLLVFDGAPLSEVVEQFNRQNTKRLALGDDAELSALRISGTFPASGSERITRFLQERFGVAVHEDGDEIVLSRQ